MNRRRKMGSIARQDSYYVVSGLSLTLLPGRGLQYNVIEFLRQDTRICFKDIQGNKLPIVTECKSEDEARSLQNDIENQEGVFFVNLHCVHFSDETINSPAAIER